MTPVTTFAGRRVALFGLGGSGLATALALQAGGADLVAFDDDPASVGRAAGEGVPTAELREEDWSRLAALVLAPGVPLTHPAPHWTVERAKASGIEVIGDIELFCRERAKIAPDAPFVAITGTNGKSTTTALVAHLLREAGADVQMGGNIGTAILSLAPPGDERVHVIEMSSFQIDLTPSLAPSVGVLMNISPDHLDRHGSMERYAAIKERLVAGAETAIVVIDDAPSRAIYDRRAASGRPVVAIAEDMLPADGYHYEGSRVFATRGTTTRKVAELKGIGSLRGVHNAQNAAVALAVADALGAEEESVVAALATFPGLHHRMEEVGRIGTAVFVNDSKATNADSAEKALASFDDVFWILGGRPKEGGIAPLAAYFPRVAKAYLIGDAAPDFAATLEGAAPYLHCGTLDRAVSAAAADAAASGLDEPVILLSPACASYDQYPNFERRGDHFRDLVRALPGITLKG
ncbi:UDP-N-acetylmuramoyl-L-alanine--D-glutamate ligase [uncultured Enterovirga sp.]|uniref:UDP-N-acetylmuramoyl-L-alanine--D-glutamate ligase n=1 Tax=uncultured Enterovirga sp. TaxID=2026352 RepID=UPI0035C9FB61